MQPKLSNENLHKLYVDHLTISLESRPIGEILDFLAKYCGWEELFAYVWQRVEEKRIIEIEKKYPEDEWNLRKLWTSNGVPVEKQDRLIAEIDAKAQPGARVGPWVIGE